MAIAIETAVPQVLRFSTLVTRVLAKTSKSSLYPSKETNSATVVEVEITWLQPASISRLSAVSARKWDIYSPCLSIKEKTVRAEGRWQPVPPG